MRHAQRTIRDSRAGQTGVPFGTARKGASGVGSTRMAQSELIVLKLIVLRLRKSAGMTQAEMAELLRVPLSTLTRWETETLDTEANKKVLGLIDARSTHKKG